MQGQQQQEESVGPVVGVGSNLEQQQQEQQPRNTNDNTEVVSSSLEGRHNEVPNDDVKTTNAAEANDTMTLPSSETDVMMIQEQQKLSAVVMAGTTASATATAAIDHNANAATTNEKIDFWAATTATTKTKITTILDSFIPKDKNKSDSTAAATAAMTSTNTIFRNETTAASTKTNTNTTTHNDAKQKVSSKRKEELLLEARNERIRWILQAPLPYSSDHKSKVTTTANLDDNDGTDQRIQTFQDCHACNYIPSALNVLNVLYHDGISDTTTINNNTTKINTTIGLLGDRIEQVLGESFQTDRNIALPNGNQILETELQKFTQTAKPATVVRENSSGHNSGTTNNNNVLQTNQHYLILKSYQSFIRKLQDPVCVTMVQGMRQFCTDLSKKSATTTTTTSAATTNVEEEALVSKIKSYVSTTFDTIIKSTDNYNKRNPTTATTTNNSFIWKNIMSVGEGSMANNNNNNNVLSKHGNHTLTPMEEEMIRRSFESFIFAHCNEYIRTVLLYNNTINIQKDKEFYNKLHTLRFVQPKHLDIHCFNDIVASAVTPTSSCTLDVDELLQEPINALLMIDQYFSPYEKLQCILQLYRTVNVALSKALNHGATSTIDDNNGKTTQKTHRKLPSADDVLPTIIYIVLRGQPKNLIYNLRFIEDFSPSEYLRGEAGYAYTNLYGAVHFILELNINVATAPGTTNNNNVNDTNNSQQPQQPSNRLSISPEEYRDGIEKSKVIVNDKYETIEQQISASNSNPTTANNAQHQKSINDMEVQKLVHASCISPMEIRLARLRGEVIDINWALRLCETKTMINITNNNPMSDDIIGNTNGNYNSSLPVDIDEEQQQSLSAANSFDDTSMFDGKLMEHQASMSIEEMAATTSSTRAPMTVVPMGFQRNYTYLSARPEDIRLADLPLLLDEYRMLVRTTETLLGEKLALSNKVKKEKNSAVEQRLYQTAHTIDPTLIPPPPSSS